MTWNPDLEQLYGDIKYTPMQIFNSQPWLFKVTDNDRIDLYVSLDGRNGTGTEGLGPNSQQEPRRSP